MSEASEAADAAVSAYIEEAVEAASVYRLEADPLKSVGSGSPTTAWEALLTVSATF
jgi:hypothetical protein